MFAGRPKNKYEIKASEHASRLAIFQGKLVTELHNGEEHVISRKEATCWHATNKSLDIFRCVYVCVFACVRALLLAVCVCKECCLHVARFSDGRTCKRLTPQ